MRASHPASHPQAADPGSPDGGGYWRGETEKTPPVDPIVLSGPNAAAGAALIRAGHWLDDPQLSSAGRAALDLVYERAYALGQGVQLFRVHDVAESRQALAVWERITG